MNENEKATEKDEFSGIYGLFLEGARWDNSSEEGILAESYPKVLISKMPYILLIPKIREKEEITQKEIGKDKENVILLIFFIYIEINIRFTNARYIEQAKGQGSFQPQGNRLIL